MRFYIVMLIFFKKSVVFPIMKPDFFFVRFLIATVNGSEEGIFDFTYKTQHDDFFGYDYIRNGLERNVIAYSYTINGTCTQATRVGVNGFNFRPEEKGIYTFKFWNGKDNSNKDIWIEKTVVVQ